MNSRKDSKEIAQQRLMFEKYLAKFDYGINPKVVFARDEEDCRKYRFPASQKLWEAWLACAKANQNI